jgi:hypothetical protein
MNIPRRLCLGGRNTKSGTAAGWRLSGDAPGIRKGVGEAEWRTKCGEASAFRFTTGSPPRADRRRSKTDFQKPGTFSVHSPKNDVSKTSYRHVAKAWSPKSLQFCVIRFRLFQNGNIAVGVFPEPEEILIRRLGFGGVAF